MSLICGLESISFAVLSALVAASISIQSLLAAAAVIGIGCTVLLYAKSPSFRRLD
ncbi:hypothetical protein [Metabacillus sp. 84]|uniref:hypothetical protein n=1 Tax=unclassified Metabacillus TaxID=2675274 RepID=UPI003CFAFAE8